MESISVYTKIRGENLMNLIYVIRPNDTAIVSIIPEKESGKFRFVNFTKNHICSCLFDTFEDALQDLKRKQMNGEVVSYRIVDYKDEWLDCCI